jgi:glycosyltransferase involved in cell wall biosynthesis
MNQAARNENFGRRDYPVSVQDDLTREQVPPPSDISRGTVSIVLPALNEREALPIVIADIRHHLPNCEIVVIDDGSEDETAAVARELECLVVQHATNQGKGSALRTGFAASSGDIIICMDADATYPGSAIPKLVSLLADHDYVRADRAINRSNTPRTNRLGNAVMSIVLQTLHGLGPGDHLSGLYGFRADVFEDLATDATGFDIEVEIGIKVKERGLRIATMPIEYRPRVGDKKLHPLKDGVRILGRILRLVLVYRPLLLFGLPGLTLMVVSLVAAFALAGGPIVTSYLGLAIHTFIVASLGVLAGFQLLTFGIAGAVYRRHLGFRVSPALDTITSSGARSVAAITGATITTICGIWLTVTIVGWIAAGGPEFTATRSLVITSTSAVFGLQLLSASLFVTLIASRAR